MRQVTCTLVYLAITILISTTVIAEQTIGDITFQTFTITGGSSEDALAASDLDGDGIPELLVASQSEDWLRVMQYGTEQFSQKAQHALLTSPNALHMVPLENGAHNIVVPHHETQMVSILVIDNGLDLHHVSGSPIETQTAPHIHYAQLIDVDGDNVRDLVTDNRGAAAANVRFGVTGDAFSDSLIPVPLGGDPYLGFAFADLNKDGRMDFVSPNSRSVGATIQGPQIREFGEPVQLGSDIPGFRPFCIEIADLDGDDDLDIVAASEGSGNALHVFANNGVGEFARSGTYIASDGGARCVQAGNLDGNSYPDLLVTSWDDGILAVLNDGNELVEYPVELSAIRNPYAGLLVDFNKDGIDDIVVMDGTSTNGVVYVSATKNNAAPNP